MRPYMLSFQHKLNEVLNFSLFMRNLGVMWKVLSPDTSKWRERLRCRCFEGVRWVFDLHLLYCSPQSGLHTHPLIGRGRVMHSAEMWFDSFHSMFLSFWGYSQIKRELGQCLSCWTRGRLICLARPALYLSLWAVFIIRAIWANTSQSCDAITHVQQHYFQRICIHTPLVSLSRTIHILYYTAVFTLHLY